MNPLYLILPAVMLSGCVRSSEIRDIDFEVEELYFDNTKAGHRLAKDEYDVDRVVCLSLPEGMMLADADIIRLTDDRIFILDQMVNNALLAFDRNGNFLFKAGGVGGGPGEFIGPPTDFAVREDGSLVIFEKESPRLVIFDRNGELKSSEKLSEGCPYSFTVTDRGNHAFAYSVKQNYFEGSAELAIVSPDENRINAYFPMNKNQNYTRNLRPFSIVNGKTAFIPNMSDRFYIIEGDSISKVCRVRFETPFISDELRDAIRYGGDPRLVNKERDRIQCIYCYEENDHWVSIEYARGGAVLRYLRSKDVGFETPGGSMFLGFMPSKSFIISGDKLVFLVTDEDVDAIREDCEEEADGSWNSRYTETADAVKSLIDGELATPALVFVSLSERA